MFLFRKQRLLFSLTTFPPQPRPSFVAHIVSFAALRRYLTLPYLTLQYNRSFHFIPSLEHECQYNLDVCTLAHTSSSTLGIRFAPLGCSHISPSSPKPVCFIDRLISSSNHENPRHVKRTHKVDFQQTTILEPDRPRVDELTRALLVSAFRLKYLTPDCNASRPSPHTTARR